MRFFSFVLLIIACLLLTDCSTITPKPVEKNLTRAAKLNVRLGFALIEKNQLREAKQKFLLSSQEAPNNPSSWYALGYFYEKMGNSSLAEKYYKKAIKIDSHSGQAHNIYAIFLCRHHQFQQALKEFTLATLEPNDTGVADAYKNKQRCISLMTKPHPL